MLDDTDIDDTSHLPPSDEIIVQAAKDLCVGKYNCDLEKHVWRPVFNKIISSHMKLTVNQNKVHKLWHVSGGHLRNKTRDDALLASVLRILLPGYTGDGLTLFRGECRSLYDSGQIGFCWTPDIEIARSFASGVNAIKSGGGVLLKAFAPGNSILAPPNSSGRRRNVAQENEYTCDPAALDNITVVSYHPHSARQEK
ncbi:hypothetical protein [Marinagarivorans cellulosilyticus]|uniref:Uncharacterized protein n=1 Tax=Marinagarivorans cellulosilyticus TaxID=2721545 RepID=A0AAN1WHG8_9GAMM|nr:hypothetical protein [Marinagarivorans cellulosilyticus]BCD97691.1 hypothetical protein MARGE09_P1892 [Marinagarivorans cellulosilyticus]